MVSILITGGTGFIGIPLVKRLHELGHKLKLLVRESSDITPFKEINDIKYIIGDVRDKESLNNALNDIDIIYHLAAYTAIWAKKKSTYYDINVKGTENISNIVEEFEKRYNKNLRRHSSTCLSKTYIATPKFESSVLKKLRCRLMKIIKSPDSYEKIEDDE